MGIMKNHQPSIVTTRKAPDDAVRIHKIIIGFSLGHWQAVCKTCQEVAAVGGDQALELLQQWSTGHAKNVQVIVNAKKGKIHEG